MRKWVVISSHFSETFEQHCKWRYNGFIRMPSPINISLDINQLSSNP